MSDVARVFRYYADLADKEAGRLVDTERPECPQPDRLRTGRGVRADRAVELPAPPDELEDRPGPRRRQHRDHEAGQLTPLSTIHLTRLLEEAGVPGGVVNLVLGPGPRVGQALADSPDVDLISLTGGLDAGRALLRAAAVNVKRVALELGGKSPNIVFADADFETAVDNALTAAFVHSGQVCSAGCRAIVEDSIYDAFVAEIGRRADRIRLGLGIDDATEAGALISADAPGQGRGSCRVGPRRRCPTGRRRPPTRRAGAAGRLLLSADRVRRRPARHADRPRGGLRAGPDRRAVHDRGRRRSRSATTRPTAWPAPSGPPTPGAPSASRPGSATAPSGSTTTTRTCHRPNGAGSSSRASAGSSARAVSTNTARRSTSGRTPIPSRVAGSPADRSAAGGLPERGKAPRVSRRRLRVSAGPSATPTGSPHGWRRDRRPASGGTAERRCTRRPPRRRRRRGT